MFNGAGQRSSIGPTPPQLHRPSHVRPSSDIRPGAKAKVGRGRSLAAGRETNPIEKMMGDRQATQRASWLWGFPEWPQDVVVSDGAVDDVDPKAIEYWALLTQSPQADHVEMSNEEAAELEAIQLLESDEAVAEESSRPRAPKFGIVLVDPLENQIDSEILEVRGSQELPSIWRVHPSIREQESEAYDPKLVSIGPLHLGNERLLPMKELKFRYLKDLLRRSRENSLGNYIKAMRDCEPQARMQYAEEIKLTEDEFVRMMVIDGSFIVEHLLKWWFSKKTGEKAQPTVKLFEQSVIPTTTVAGTSRDGSLFTLMDIALGFLDVQLPREDHLKADDVLHLLHLHHICLNPSRTPDQPHHCSCRQLVLYPFRKTTSLISLVFFRLNKLLHIIFSNRKPRCLPEVPRMIPSVTELLGAGVKFKKVGMTDGVNCYLKVAFQEGTMEIPFLCVEEFTSSKLRNFIALEHCCPGVGSHFTSYGVFMDNIINTEDDVAVLRRHGIIACNKLGSDEEVAKMFNILCKGTHLNYKHHNNFQVFEEVKGYCEFTHHRWRAILVRKYFSNPWSIISLLAGIILLSLTATQTYFTVFPRT
ncbi:hypothetical protein Taro_047213 [Colocasia esculenta]|uniref:Uncharacterized protein n=1 Tax=Colocasia esculenta TaxID=4460 RepID=A0A843WS85_COLES|nr:hypothetical protein [Colocasia esculenta]